MSKAARTNWSWWQRTVWLFTGQAPSPEVWAVKTLEHMAVEALERELESIDRAHRLAAHYAKMEFIGNWSTQQSRKHEISSVQT